MGEELVGVELVDVMLGLFAAAGPDEGPAFAVDFEHVAFGAFARVAEDAHEHHRDVAHEVDGIVENDDIPRRFEFRLGLGVIDLDGAGLWHDANRLAELPPVRD